MSFEIVVDLLSNGLKVNIAMSRGNLVNPKFEIPMLVQLATWRGPQFPTYPSCASVFGPMPGFTKLLFQLCWNNDNIPLKKVSWFSLDNANECH